MTKGRWGRALPGVAPPSGMRCTSPPGSRCMIIATWNGAVIAVSNRSKVVEGNNSFPFNDVHAEYLEHSATTTRCPWKGRASYYDVISTG